MGCNSSKQEDVRKDRQRVQQHNRQQQLAAEEERRQREAQRAAEAEQEKRRRGRRAHSDDDDDEDERGFGSVGRSAALPIATATTPKDAVLKGAAAMYGTSLTEQRIQEYDFLQNIIQTTESNFIDVSANKGNVMDLHHQQHHQGLTTAAGAATSSATSPSIGLDGNGNLVGSSLASNTAAGALDSMFALPMPDDSVAVNVMDVLRLAAIAPADQDMIIEAAEEISNALTTVRVKPLPQRVVVTLAEFDQDDEEE
eukprot:TRINITY_DN103124_c0_g1_i1.p1 TRINITY_DN103124_c0_g1~~TRINITY_DN103124_c0_g1_i1.p1  ORF type:complete len:267 (+),score=137.95 TRINITY_DN103124_c0_g1_i1:39-803(+)